MSVELLLLEEVKGALNITWNEEDTNNKLTRIIKDAKATLDYKLGSEIDYSKSGQEHSLFINYCMYSYNNCLNEFDTNYINEIYQLRQKYEVMSYETKQL